MRDLLRLMYSHYFLQLAGEAQQKLLDVVVPNAGEPIYAEV
jgi:hypothetical protein